MFEHQIIATVPYDTVENNLEISDVEYDRMVDDLKKYALEIARDKGAKEWLIYAIKQQHHLDGIVSEMRHIDSAQIAILYKLLEMKPDLHWYRGGTLKTWEEKMGQAIKKHFSEDDLSTLVIDGGENGVLGRPEVAMNFIRLTPRKEAVLYSLPVSSLIEGLQTNAIRLVSEHNYDLRVLPGEDRKAYLAFCRKHLNIDDATNRE